MYSALNLAGNVDIVFISTVTAACRCARFMLIFDKPLFSAMWMPRNSFNSASK